MAEKQADTPREKTFLFIRPRHFAAVLLPALFFAYFFSLTYKYPLNDPDIWWHLKTGHYIIETREIPKEDHFSYTTPSPLQEEQVRGMRSQWLGQVIYAAADRVNGLAGVTMLRNFLIVFPMVVLFLWLRHGGLGLVASAAVVLFPLMIQVFQVFYSFERPQGLSFLLVLLLVMLLERLRSHSSGPGRARFDMSMALLPALMALWANIHAGFIVGVVIICIYFSAELLTLAWRRLRNSPADRAQPVFFAICLAAIAATVFNPNTFYLSYSYIEGLASKFFKDFSQTLTAGPGKEGWVESVVLEFKPLYYFYSELRYQWVMFYWIFTGLLFLSLFIKYWARRSIDLAELITVGFISFFANYYARGLMFSLTVLPFYLGKTMLELKLPPIKYREVFKVAVVALLIVSIGFLTFTYPGRLGVLLRPSVTSTWISPWYPLGLAHFVEQTKIPGPMYNFYTWGGFLIWRLYPRYKVFVDGRALDRNISYIADSILKTFPAWRGQLDAYNINFIVIPVVFRESGHIIPLAPALVREPGWKLVYLRNNSAVFVRDVPQNQELIKMYNIDKMRVFKEIVAVENILLSGMPNNPVYNVSKADALFSLGQFAEAKAIYERFPRYSRDRLSKLRSMGY